MRNNASKIAAQHKPKIGAPRFAPESFRQKKGGREKPSAEIFCPRDTARPRELSRKRTPQRQRRIYASNSSRTFFADSGMTVPGPKMALAPLSSRNL